MATTTADMSQQPTTSSSTGNHQPPPLPNQGKYIRNKTSTNSNKYNNSPANNTGQGVMGFDPSEKGTIDGGKLGTSSSFNSYDTFFQLGNGVLSETNLYIRELSEDCTDEKLRQLCAAFGKIVSTKAILDKATKKCKGYGFVDFDSSESAHNAIRGLAEQGINAQMAKQQEQDPTNLYIANLPSEYDEDKLSELLGAHGMVISSRVLRNPDGSSRGVGFCRMSSTESCASIITEYHGKRLSPNAQPLIVKLADSSSRKFKRSTPSLRSFYSESGYKSKMATPLMTTPLIDPSNAGMNPSMAFNAMPNPAAAQYPATIYNADLLSSQFQQQFTLLANGQHQDPAQQHSIFYPYQAYNLPYSYIPQTQQYVVLPPEYALAEQQQQLGQQATASMAGQQSFIQPPLILQQQNSHPQQQQRLPPQPQQQMKFQQVEQQQPPPPPQQQHISGLVQQPPPPQQAPQLYHQQPMWPQQAAPPVPQQHPQQQQPAMGPSY